jgi:glycosyltransferase involved in cell wall biosynthesis
MPAFSIVVPTFNRPHTLARAVRSVLAQTHADWELLVVNDGDQDMTPRVEEIAGRDARIRMLRTRGRQGAAIARTTGIEAARGDVVCFLDDDDEFMPEYLTRLGARMADKQLDFCWVGVRRLREDSFGRIEETTLMHSADSAVPHSLSFVMWIAFSYGLAVRRDWLARHGGPDLTLKVSDDREMMFRFIRAGARYADVPAPLVTVHIQRRQSLSQFHDAPGRAAATAAEDQLIRARYRELFDRDPELRRAFAGKIATKYYHARSTADYWRTMRELATLGGLSTKVVSRALTTPFRQLWWRLRQAAA